jgi:hypothetical protein
LFENSGVKIWSVYKVRVIQWLLFNPKWTIFQLYHGKNKLHEMMLMMVSFVLDQHTWLDFYCASSPKQVCGQTCPSTLTHYSDSEPASFCSCFILLCAWRRDNKYQIYSLWFDPYGAWTHDLPHSRRAH